MPERLEKLLKRRAQLRQEYRKKVSLRARSARNKKDMGRLEAELAYIEAVIIEMKWSVLHDETKRVSATF